MTNKQRFRILLRDDFRCRYCGKEAPSVALEVDHVVPRSKGGSDDDGNLVAACFECNRGKGAIILDEELGPELEECLRMQDHARAIEILVGPKEAEIYREIMQNAPEAPPSYPALPTFSAPSPPEAAP